MIRFPLHILCALTFLACHASAQLIPYQFPAELPTSTAYNATVAGQYVPAMQTERGAFLSFGMRGPVEVVVKLAKTPGAVVIRPLAAGIKAQIQGDGFRFTLPRPMNLSVEVDGNLKDPLLVFANPELANPPDRNDPKVKFFEGGRIHDAGEILLGDGETLYLEGGAVVRAVVRARNAKNVTVRGPGILDASQRKHKTNMLAPTTDSILIGYNDMRGIDGVLIEGLEIEGKTITSAEDLRVQPQHVRNIRFQARSE